MARFGWPEREKRRRKEKTRRKEEEEHGMKWKRKPRSGFCSRKEDTDRFNQTRTRILTVSYQTSVFPKTRFLLVLHGHSPKDTDKIMSVSCQS